MAARKNQPLHSGFAAIVALTSMVAAPVLAAPDRNICEETAAPTLDVATTEFSRTTAAEADDAIKLLGPTFELASRKEVADEESAPSPADKAAEVGVDSEQKDAAIPADTGPLVHKRQMYRRDI